MKLSISLKSRNDIIVSSMVILLLAFVMMQFDNISSKFSDVIDKALTSKGGKVEVALIIIIPLFLTYWLRQIIVKKNYLRALSLQILLFPITFKAKSIFSINAFIDQTGYIQKISVTTFLIVILFLFMLIRGQINRPINKSWRIFEKLILLYAICLTITQLFTHSLYSAIWLTIGGIWQFICIFYILTSVVTSYDKLMVIYKSIVTFTIFNMVMRIISEEQSFIQNFSFETLRVGAGAMGPAVSYGGYLCVVLTIVLLIYRCTRKKIYLLFIPLIFVELLYTFTRGAYLSILVLGFIYFWKYERKFFYSMSVIAITIIVILGNIIWLFISHRGEFSIGLKMFQIQNVQVRIDLINTYFREYFNFSLIGNGIGKFTLIPNLFNIPIPPHNILIALIDQAGVLIMILFILLIIYSVYIYISISKLKVNNTGYIISAFSTIALLQWFFFANTTSTYLNIYYPYEASSIFWIILFISPVLSVISQTSNMCQYSCRFN